MTLHPLSEDDPRLRAVSAKLTLKQLRTREQQAEIDALLDYVYAKANKGVAGETYDRSKQSVVGLSANQVSLMKQISIVDLSIGRKDYHDIHVLINPQIVWRSKSMLQKNEGCVNFPTIRGLTSRSKSVKVQALDRSGNELTLKLTGWPAVLIQHEYDHLNGHLFIDRLLDPTQADLVEAGEFKEYRKAKGGWRKKTDMSGKIWRG